MKYTLETSFGYGEPDYDKNVAVIVTMRGQISDPEHGNSPLGEGSLSFTVLKDKADRVQIMTDNEHFSVPINQLRAVLEIIDGERRKHDTNV